MKRLIVIIKTLLFTSLGFGYPSGVLVSNIHERTQPVTFSEQIVMMKVNDSDLTLNYQSFINNLSTHTCSFINMSKLYKLSSGEDHGNRCDEFMPKLNDTYENLRVEKTFKKRTRTQ